MPQKFPLQWPVGYPRTENPGRSAFKNPSIFIESKQIVKEINLLIGDKWGRDNDRVTISSNVPLRYDGFPRADYLRTNILDKGVAVYFSYNGAEVVLCCDKWNTVESNMRAISLSIEAIRATDRWGVSDFIKRSFTGFKALPANATPARKWYEVLEFLGPPGNFQLILDHYRRLAKALHPDATTGTGSNEKFHELQQAYEEAKEVYERK